MGLRTKPRTTWIARRRPPVPDVVLHVPGRIEVLGKHVDYAGGRSLLCATDRAFSFAVTPSSTGTLRLRDTVSGQQLVVDPDRLNAPTPARGSGWGLYPRAVVRRVVADFGPEAIPGCDVEFSSDIPSSAGVSSSSAFVTGLFLALDAAAGLLEQERGRRAIPDTAALAGYLGAIESGRPFAGLGEGAGGVGVRGGAQDHTAILCSREGALIQACFGPVRVEDAVEIPADLRFVIGVSGVRAPKARAARARYNALSDRARRIIEIWREAHGESEDDAPHLGAVVRRRRAAGAGPPEVIDEVSAVMRGSHDPEAEALAARVEQFVIETEMHVPGVVAALRSREMDRVGHLVDQSQELADRVLENQVPATRALAATARELGATAASSFGAGFGGAVWALVPASEVGDFSTAWKERYSRDFPRYARRVDVFETVASEPAGPLPARFRS